MNEAAPAGVASTKPGPDHNQPSWEVVMAHAHLSQADTAGNAQSVPFAFQNHPIRTIVIEGQPWFVARDVCAALGISWQRGGKTLAPVPLDWKLGWEFPTPKGKRSRTIISEPAVYKLAFRSNKPEADTFTNWVASVVLPSIRQSGQFAVPAAQPGQLTPAQCRHLHDVMDAKCSALPRELSGKVRAEAWTRFNRHFRIARYEQLPPHQFTDALAYLIGLQTRAAHKALPPAAPPPRVDADEVQRLVAQARTQGGALHNTVADLWQAIWKDVDAWKYPDRPLALTQLRYAADESFRAFDVQIELLRAMVRAVDVTYREMRSLRG